MRAWLDGLHHHVKLWLQDAGTDAPNAWMVTLAVFLPQNTSLEVDTHGLVPSAPLAPLVSGSLQTTCALC